MVAAASVSWCQVAVAGLEQAVKAVAGQAGCEQSQQPGAVTGAGHRTEHRVESLHLPRAGQHRGLEDEGTDQHEYDSARDAANRAKRPGERGKRPGDALRGEPLPEVKPNRPAANLRAAPFTASGPGVCWPTTFRSVVCAPARRQ
jgi:hypothetical protein